MSPASGCPPTCSAGTCGWPATTCSWSRAPTSTARRSWCRPKRKASTPRELADRYNRMIVEDLHALGLSYDLFTRTTTRNHYAVAQELFKGVYAQRLHDRRDDAGRDLAVDRAYAARPLHRGNVPDLRLRQRARRPVRQLRQPARPDRPDQPAQPDQRRDAGVHRDRALLPGPAGARRRAGRLAADAYGLASERAEVLAQPARRHPAAGDDARHRLGHSGAAARLGRQPGQAPLRVVRRRHRLPVGVDRVGPAYG